jgi:hypothetical protein
MKIYGAKYTFGVNLTPGGKLSKSSGGGGNG